MDYRKKLLEEIRKNQVSILKSLQTAIDITKSECDHLSKKIELEGISGYYSCASGIQRNCDQIRNYCNELYYLKSWERNILNEKKYKTEKKEEDEVGSKKGGK